MFDVYDKLPVCHDITSGKVRTADVLLNEKVEFSSLLLEEKIQRGLTKCGYTLLSPIQKTALPLALTGISLIAHAKSGTGKTLIYLLTSLNIHLKTSSKSLHSLILAPTREIAKQVYDVFKSVACFIEDLNVEYFIGGIPLDLDVLKCKSCHIAIGAPGRIKHLIDLGELNVKELQLLVLDEVDALLHNKEFAITNLVSNLPASRQTLVCTATFSDEINSLSKPISADMKYVTIHDTESEASSCTSNVLLGITQYVAPVFTDTSSLDPIRKRNKLIEILQKFKYDQCFIFVNYLSLVKSVFNYLKSNGLSALWLSSEQNQSARISILNKLRMNECRILITTDLAARGIDVHNVNLVVNVGIPNPPDVYVHRMGRAGRYGSEGSVITILHEGTELDQFKRAIRAVFTDPIDLYMLPKEINEKLIREDLPVITCTPQPDPALTQFTFRRNLKPAQKDGGGKKKKNKKKKTAEKAAAAVSKPEKTVIVKESSSEECCGDDAESAPRISLNECVEMENLVQHYVQSITEEIRRSESVSSQALKDLFLPTKRPINKVRFTDYSNVTEEIAIEVGPEEASCEEQHVPDVSLLYFINAIRSKHAFLDEQKIPCSTKVFFELLDRNEHIFSQYTSNMIYNLIKDVLVKIRELVTPPSSSPEMKQRDFPINKSLKRIGESDSRIKETIRSEETEDSSYGIFESTSNWMAGRANRIKRTKKESPRKLHPKTNLTKPAALDSGSSNFHRTERNLTGPQNECNIEAETSCDHQRQRKAGAFRDSQTGIDVQCPECHHKFSVHVDTPNHIMPVLQPLSAFVNCDVERNIWQHHFGFISQHVRSLPTFFANRN